jgi:hypothetical protein
MHISDTRWKRSAGEERCRIPVNIVSSRAKDANGSVVAYEGMQIAAVLSTSNGFRRYRRNLRKVQHRCQRSECPSIVASVPARLSEAQRVERLPERVVLYAELGG